MRVRRGGQWNKDLEFHPRTVGGEGGEQDEAAAITGTTITAVSPNLGVQQRNLEHSAEDEEGRAAKRKPVSSPSGSRTKAKYAPLSVGTNTSASVKETFSMIEELVALNPQSNVPEDSGCVWFVPWDSCQAKAATLGVGCEPNSPSVANVLLNQPGRASLPKVVHPAQYISEKEQRHQDIKEATFIPVHKEINSEVIWEQMQKLRDDDDLVSLSEPTYTKLFELANKLVMENKRLKDGQIVLLQQVKDQKQMIDELSKQNRAEVDCLKEETAQLIKDKEEMQRRLLRANVLVKLITDVLGATEASKDGMNEAG